MKYQINNFKVNPKDLNNLENIIKAKLKINNFKYKILSKSIDARDKNNVFVITFYPLTTDELADVRINKKDRIETKQLTMKDIILNK